MSSQLSEPPSESDARSGSGLRFHMPRIERGVWLCWMCACALVLLFGLVRKPCVGLWADLVGTASLALLLTIAFYVPYLARYANLSVGAVSAVASLSANRLFNQGTVASILSGLVVGCVFGLLLAVIDIRHPRKSWDVSGFVGVLALLSTAVWQSYSPAPPRRPDLEFSEMTGMTSVLIPAVVALVGMYLIVHWTPLAFLLRDSRYVAEEPEGERILRGAFLLSGIISGFAGACAGALLASSGLSHASFFLLSPLALMLLSGGCLGNRRPQLLNLAPAAVIFASLVYLTAVPGWVWTGRHGEMDWQRTSRALPLTDSLIGLGWGMILTAMLVLRDTLLIRPPSGEHHASEHKERRATSVILILGTACSIALGVGLAVSSSLFHSRPSDAALFLKVTGNVQKVIAGHAVPDQAAREDMLFTGDSILTGKTGSALLRVPDRNALRIDPSSNVTLVSLANPVANRHRTVILVASGSVWARAQEAMPGYAESTFEIRTPAATALTRGGEFHIQTSGNETLVTVGKGLVQVDNGRDSVTATTGDKCIASTSRGVDFPVRMSEQEMLEWEEYSQELQRAWPQGIAEYGRKLLLSVLATLVVMGIIAEMNHHRKRRL